MTSFQMLVFDFDGTLVDTKIDIADSVNRTLKELELRTLDRDNSIHLHRQRREPPDDPVVWRGRDTTTCPGAIDVFMRHYEEHLMDQTELFPNCRETLEHFTGKENTILSNKPTRFHHPDTGCAGLARSVFDHHRRRFDARRKNLIPEACSTFWNNMKCARKKP